MESKLPEEILRQLKEDAETYSSVMVWVNQNPKGEEQLFYEYISATSYEKGATEWAQWKVKYDELKAEYIDLGKRFNTAQTTLTDQAMQHQTLKERCNKMEAALRKLNAAIDKTWNECNTKSIPDKYKKAINSAQAECANALKEGESNNLAFISQDAHEKEVIMQAFSKVRQIFEGREWIMEGRGSYPYNDDRYKEEVRYMYDEFDQLYKDTWHNIKSKSIEYREWIINEYLHKDHPAIHDILTRLGYCKKEGNKDRGLEAFAKYLDEQRNSVTPDMWAEKVIWGKPNAFQEWLQYFNQQNRNNG